MGEEIMTALKRRDAYRKLNVRCPTSGKICYPSKFAAYKLLERGSRRIEKKFMGRNCYYCKDCNGYHITSCN